MQAGLLTEMFARTRESALLGLVGVGLMAYAHLDSVGLPNLLIWIGLMVVVVLSRWHLATSYLRTAPQEAAELDRWGRREQLATIAMALAWTSSLWLLDSGAMDGPFYFKMSVLVAVAAFTLGTQGMVPRIYFSFLCAFIISALAFFSTWSPSPGQGVGVVELALSLYAGMLAMRSRIEHRRARQGIEAQLGQQALVERLRELASRDVLTNAFSRSHMQQALRFSASRLRRSGQPYSVAMLDVDHFKQVNDRWGHVVGDEVLKRITAVMQQELRDTDLFGRWGGEEFIVLLPETRLRAACETAGRLRACLQRIDFAPAAPGLRVTVSIGVARAAEGETPDSVIGRADTALYSAKGGGRNRVAAAPAFEQIASARTAGQAMPEAGTHTEAPSALPVPGESAVESG